MATTLVTCPRCNGTGRYNAPTRYGPDCFRCEGTGKTRPTRERPAPKTREYAPIEDCCIDWNSPHALLAQASAQTIEYFGGRAKFEAMAEAWEIGYREIRISPNAALPLYR